MCCVYFVKKALVFRYLSQHLLCVICFVPCMYECFVLCVLLHFQFPVTLLLATLISLSVSCESVVGDPHLVTLLATLISSQFCALSISLSHHPVIAPAVPLMVTKQ